MADKTFGVEVEFDADTADLEKLSTELAESRQEVERLEKEFDKLSKTDALTKTFREQRKATADAKKSVQSLKDETKKLAAEIKNTDSPTKKQIAQLARLRKNIQQATAAERKQSEALAKTRVGLREAGINTRKLATEEKKLKVALESSRASIEKAAVSHRKLASSTRASADAAKQSALANKSSLESFKKVGIQLGIAATAAFAVTRAFVGSIKQSIAFERALVGVRKTTEGTREQFKALSDDLESLSIATGTSAVDLAKIAATGGQLGVGIDNLTEFTKQANIMSVAFNIAAEDAGTAIGTLSNVFDIPINEIGRLVDVINVLGNNTNATEAQITDALQRIGGTAKNIGLTAENTAALVDTLIALGEPPERAATALGLMLSKLQNINIASPKSKAALESIGLSATELGDAVRDDAQGAINDLFKRLSELDPRQASEALNQIFGEEVSRRVIKLTGNFDQYIKTQELIADRTKIAGAAAREQAAALDSTDAQLNRAREASIALGRALGDSLSPTIEAVASLFADATEKLLKFSQQADKSVETLSDKLDKDASENNFFKQLSDSANNFLLSLGFTVRKSEEFVEKNKEIKKSAEEAGESLENSGKSGEVFAKGVGAANAAALASSAAIGKAAVFASKIDQELRKTGKSLATASKDVIEVIGGLIQLRDRDTLAAQRQAEQANNLVKSQIDTAKSSTDLIKALEGIATSYELGITSADDYAIAILAADEKEKQFAANAQLVKQALEVQKISLEELTNAVTDGFGEQIGASEKLIEAYGKIPGSLDKIVQANLAQARTTADLAELENVLATAFKNGSISAEQLANQQRQINLARLDFSETTNEAVLSLIKEADSADVVNKALAELQQRQLEGRATAEQLAQGQDALTASLERLSVQTKQTAEAQAEANRKAARLDADIAARKDATAKADQARAQQAAAEDQAATDRLKNRNSVLTEAAGGLSNIVNGLQESVASLSRNAIIQLERVSNEFRILGSKIREAEQPTAGLNDALNRLRFNQKLLPEASTFTKLLNEMAQAAQNVRIQFFQQELRAEKLADQLSKNSDATATYIGFIETARDSLNLLDDVQLDALNATIDEARQRLKTIEDAAKAAKDELEGIGDSLQDELDRINGNQSAIENRRFQEQLDKISELEQQGGEAAARQAQTDRRLAEEIHQRKLANIRERAKAEQERESNQTGNTDVSPNNTQPRQNTQPTQTASTNFGNTVQANVDFSGLTKSIQDLANRPVQFSIDGRNIITAITDITDLSK